MRKWLCLFIVFVAPKLSWSLDYMKLEEIKVGMEGVGRTQNRPDSIEEFEVRVVDVLEKWSGNRDVILVECGGPFIDESGVSLGMSGSPIYFDGKLAGAIAYTWSFQKKNFAGVQPIEYMRTLEARLGEERAEAMDPVDWREVELHELKGPPEAAFYMRDLERAFLSRAGACNGGPEPIPLQLSLSGRGALNGGVLDRGLKRLGLAPLSSGGIAEGSSSRASSANPLEPGSAIGVGLVTGDVSVYASGTLTYREGEKVVAFGHSFMNMGRIELPMMEVRVAAVLPRLSMSLKMASVGEEIGVFVEDGEAGMAGIVGREARKIPVVMRFQNAAQRERVFRFELARNHLFAPFLLSMVLEEIIANFERDFGPSALEIREGSAIKIKGHDDVRMRDLFSGDAPLAQAASYVGSLLSILLRNMHEEVEVEEVDLSLRLTPGDYRTADIRKAYASRRKLRAGEKLDLEIVLKPFREEETRLTRELRIPRGVPPGKLNIYVGSSASIMKLQKGRMRSANESLGSLVRILNSIKANDEAIVLLTREVPGIFVRGRSMPNLPCSVFSILGMKNITGEVSPVNFSVLSEESIRTGYHLEGLNKIELEITE